MKAELIKKAVAIIEADPRGMSAREFAEKMWGHQPTTPKRAGQWMKAGSVLRDLVAQGHIAAKHLEHNMIYFGKDNPRRF